jgi:F-type H+-transporting ATPase subunit b
MDVIKEGLLKVDPGLLLWTVITFVILLLILWKSAWKPIVEALDARSERIRGDLSNADKSRQEAEELLLKHKEMMDKAKEEALDIIGKSKIEAEKIRNEIIEKANSDARNIADSTKNEITTAKNAALAELKSEIVNISTDIASKVISKNLNPDDQKSIINETLDKLGSVQ